MFRHGGCIAHNVGFCPSQAIAIAGVHLSWMSLNVESLDTNDKRLYTHSNALLPYALL